MGQFILNGRNYSGLTYAHGVFIDTDNVIQAETSYTGSFTYTASQDCYVLVGIASINSGVGTIAIDGVPFQVIYNTSGNALEEKYPILLKKGQVLSVTSGYNIWTSKYTVYGIQEGSPVTFLSEYASACYDTTEREVGCWVDGKPLYKRTWDFSASPIIIPYNDWVDTGIPASVNIEKIISAESQYGSLANMGIEIGTGAGGFVVGANKYENTGNTRGLAYLTLLYTKTTDVAGSGKLTPTAMPTVHYDSNEKIIGTWFGETLYEKTISLTSGIDIGSYGHISLPADSIVRGLDGYAYRNSHASVDRFNGFINSGDLYASIRSGQIEYWISNIFSPVEEITFTIQYTKSS